MRARYLLAVLTAGVLAPLVVGPAAGQAQGSPTIVAGDNFFKTGDGAAAELTITAPGHVDFAYASGNSHHNVVFTGMQPSLCGTSEGPAGTAAALPSSPSPAPWAGGCEFTAAGSYPFVCGVHSNMTGRVTVLAAGGTPPPPPPPPPSPPPPPPPPPPPGPAASGLHLATIQHGFTVRGSVQIADAGSDLLARAFARRGALSGGRSTTQVQVARQLRTSVGGARTSFAVMLTPAARRALRRNGRLSITLRLTVTPPTGGPYTATRTVILRPL